MFLYFYKFNCKTMVNTPSFGPYVKTFTPLGLLISIAFYLFLLLVILSLCMFTVIVDMPPIRHKDLIMLVPLLAVSILFHLSTYSIIYAFT